MLKMTIVLASWVVMGLVAIFLAEWLVPFRGIHMIWKSIAIGWLLWTMAGFVDSLFPPGTVPRNKVVQEADKRTGVVSGSVGERVFGIAYRSSQIVHVVTKAKAEMPDEQRLAVLNAIPEMVASLYVDAAAIRAALSAAVNDLPAPDALRPEQSATEEARADAQIGLALRAYGDYRAQYAK